jgi:uncharacterized NAD(P)/FAD-binding protein YdhS
VTQVRLQSRRRYRPYPGPLDWATLRAAALEQARVLLADGYDWRVLVDALRSRTPDIWAHLGSKGQADFLTQDLRAWEVRRHRMAPSVAARVEEHMTAGCIRVLAGSVSDVIPAPKHLEVRVVGADPTGVEFVMSLSVDRLIDATGFGRTDRDVESVLLRRLIADGRAVADDHGLGFRTDDVGRLLDASGAPQPSIATLGALRRGELWESTAIPEIRNQAEQLAREFVLAAAIDPGQ